MTQPSRSEIFWTICFWWGWEMDQVPVSRVLEAHHDAWEAIFSPLCSTSTNTRTQHCYCPKLQAIPREVSRQLLPWIQIRLQAQMQHMLKMACDLISSESSQNLQAWHHPSDCQTFPADNVTRAGSADFFFCTAWLSKQLANLPGNPSSWPSGSHTKCFHGEVLPKSWLRETISYFMTRSLLVAGRVICLACMECSAQAPADWTVLALTECTNFCNTWALFGLALQS